MCGGLGSAAQKFSLRGGEGESHRSQLKGVRQGGLQPSGHGDMGDGANRPSFPIRSSSRNGGSQAPSAALLHPLPYPRNWVISTSASKLILDFPSLGGENEAERANSWL